MGLWSTLMILSKCSSPLFDTNGAGSACAWCSWRATAVASVSLTRVDLPEPDTPVTHTRRPAGMRRSTVLRLLPLAPSSTSQGWSSETARRLGTGISRRPLRYWPVSEAGSSCTAARSEEHTSELQSRENLVCRLLLEKKK